MSEAQTEKDEAAEGGKKKSKLFMIIGLILVLAVGGGAGYYFMFMPAADADEKSDKKSKKKKKKKSKKKSAEDEEDDESDDEDAGLSDADRSLEEALQEDENVTQIIELQPFIVNLADVEEARYLRMTVNLGIGGDPGGGHGPDPIFLAKVKNAMLAVLSVKKSEDVLTVKGKAKLRKELLEAAQTAAEDGHIEAIYITDFIVQL